MTTFIIIRELFYCTDTNPKYILSFPTKVKRNGQDIDSLPVDNESLEELTRFAIRTRINYDMPPLSAKALLLSVYHGRYGEVNNVVQPKKRATRTEYMQATMFVLWTAKVE